MTNRIFVAAALLTALVADIAFANAANVVVVGANGRTGKPLIKMLKERGHHVRASVRKAKTAAGLGADEVVVADITKPETLTAAVKGMDYVMCVTGSGGADPATTDNAGVAALADAAKAAGAKQFLLMSSIGAEVTSVDDPSVRIGKVMVAKNKGEAHVRATGLPYTIVRPGGLADCEPGKTGVSLGLVTAVQNREINPPAICRADVAAVMAESLGNTAAMNKTFSAIASPKDAPNAWKAKLKDLPRD